MDTKVGQMVKNHIKVGQMVKGDNKMGGKVSSSKAGGMRNEPSQQQIQETASQYNKYK
jgi:hypothetical protein